MTTDTLTLTEVDETVDTAAPTQEPHVVAPDEDIPLLRQVIPNDEARMLMRGLKSLVKRDVGPIMVCLTCQREKRPDIIQFAKRDTDGSLLMICACTVRILEGVTK